MRSFSILYAEALLLLSSFTLTIFINTFHYLDILLYFYCRFLNCCCCCCYIFIPVLVVLAVYSFRCSRPVPRQSMSPEILWHVRPAMDDVCLLPALLTSSKILWIVKHSLDRSFHDERRAVLRGSHVCGVFCHLLCGAFCTCVTAWVNKLFVSASFYLHSLDCRNMLQCRY
jgi:hypothetical protein